MRSGAVVSTRESRALRKRHMDAIEERQRRLDAMPAETARRAVVRAVARGMDLEAALNHLARGQLSGTGEAVAPGSDDAVTPVRIDGTRAQQYALVRESERARRAFEARRREAQRLLNGEAGRDELGMLR